MTNLVDRKGSNNVWLTPEKYLSPVRVYAPIGLDPCTESSNPADAANYYTEADDGLTQDWSGYGLVFVNPPYSTVLDAADDATAEEHRDAKRRLMRSLKDKGEKLFGACRSEVSSFIVLWVMKIHREVAKGVELIALLPCGARFSCAYWQDHILTPELSALCFVRGRVPFIDGRTGSAVTGNTYDSLYYGFNVNQERFCNAFRALGTVLAVNTPVQRAPRVGLLDGFV